MRHVSISFVVGLVLLSLVACNMPQQVAQTPDPDQVGTQVTLLLTQIPTATQPVVLPTLPTPGSPTPTSEHSPTPEPQPSPTNTTAPTVEPTPTQLATDPRQTLGDPDWVDTFETGQNFWVNSDEHVAISAETGYLSMQAKKADGWHSWTLTYPNLTNFYLEAVVSAQTCSGKDRYGLVFRSEENNEGYIVGLSCDGNISARKWDGESFTALLDWTSSAAIKNGEPNRLGVMARGSQFTFYVNGIPVGEAQDTSYDEGTFGLFVAASVTPNFTARFDEVAYWNLDD